jgi:hypothetical protein
VHLCVLLVFKHVLTNDAIVLLQRQIPAGHCQLVPTTHCQGQDCKQVALEAHHVHSDAGPTGLHMAVYSMKSRSTVSITDQSQCVPHIVRCSLGPKDPPQIGNARPDWTQGSKLATGILKVPLRLQECKSTWVKEMFDTLQKMRAMLCSLADEVYKVRLSFLLFCSTTCWETFPSHLHCAQNMQPR